MRKAVILAVVLGTALCGQGPRKTKSAETTRAGAYGAPAVNFHGTVKSVSGKDIVIVPDEGQEMTIHRTRKTKCWKDNREIKVAEIPVGAMVGIDVAQAPDLSLLAVNVFVETPKPVQK